MLILAACSTPLVPPAVMPTPTRQNQSDADLISQLRVLWAQLCRADISEQERAVALHEYNAGLLRLVRRMRVDALEERQLPTYPNVDVENMCGDSMRLFLRLHDDLVPAADVELSSLENRYRIPGIGVPVIGVIPAHKLSGYEKVSHHIASRGTVSALTAVLTFTPQGKPRLRLLLNRQREKVRVGNLYYPLATDWSALLEVYWNLTRVKQDRILGLLRPQELRNTTGLSSIQPYDPNKIPVILTHGLMSSAGTFDNLVNRLYADPEIRRNYQFWYFNYPTGVAWTISARIYRESLRKLRDRVDPLHTNPNWDKMVLIGHSMGGLITHYSQCEEPWNILRGADIPTDKLSPFLDAKYVHTPMADEALEALRQDYFFTPVKAGLIVYLATPHRGAPVAKYRLATALMKLVTLPQTLLKEAYNIATLQEDMFLLNPQDAYLWFTSVNQLRPDSYSIAGLQHLKVRPVPTHSIIGDQGDGDTPQSSDGVVPYWSSHIAWGTETIVPSDHSVQDCMETANDLKRLLGEYAGMNPAVIHVAPQVQRAQLRNNLLRYRRDSAAKK